MWEQSLAMRFVELLLNWRLTVIVAMSEYLESPITITCSVDSVWNPSVCLLWGFIFRAWFSACGQCCSGTPGGLTCSRMKIGVERVSRYASATSSVGRNNNEVVTDSELTQKESKEVGPSFRFMAEGNMWLLEFEASGLRVLADPWLFDDQTFWDQAWLYTGASKSWPISRFSSEIYLLIDKVLAHISPKNHSVLLILFLKGNQWCCRTLSVSTEGWISWGFDDGVCEQCWCHSHLSGKFLVVHHPESFVYRVQFEANRRSNKDELRLWPR